MRGAIMDALQGASNAGASNVSAPVDAIAWLLRNAGVPVPSNPLLGSDWMAERGLTSRPDNKLAGTIGEALGMAAPIVAAAKAPQIAAAINQAIVNARVRNNLTKQSGVLMIDGSSNAGDASKFAELVKALGPEYVPHIESAKGGSVYVTVGKQKLTKAGAPWKGASPTQLPFKARFADHPQYWGSSISSDPFTQNTVEDVFNAFKLNALGDGGAMSSMRRARIDPGLGSGVVEDVVLNKNVLANGGGVRFDVVNSAPFSMLR